jgi:hypothetical protein
MPDANTLTVGLFAVLAQHEPEAISKQTKDALKAKKARGAQLGSPANFTEAAREQSLLVRRAHLQQHPGLRQAAAFIASRWAQEVSFRQLAGELNALGFTAPRGGISTRSSVYSNGT